MAENLLFNYSDIAEAQYPQSLPDVLSKFKVARKECVKIQIDLFIILRYNEENKSTNQNVRIEKINKYF